MTAVDDRRRRSAAHVVVDDLDRPHVDDETYHHLARVLRLRSGDALTLTDGKGGWCSARWNGGTTPDVETGVIAVPRPLPLLAVAFTPTKGDRPEWVVQKLTELGIDRIVPVLTDRSVVRWDGERARRQVERWQRIAREALSQSRGVFLPSVEPVTPLAALSAAEPVRLAEPGGEAPSADGVVVVVGPEGGFSSDELTLTPGRVGLPGGVLRAETAAIVAGALLAMDRGRGAWP